MIRRSLAMLVLVAAFVMGCDNNPVGRICDLGIRACREPSEKSHRVAVARLRLAHLLEGAARETPPSRGSTPQQQRPVHRRVQRRRRLRPRARVAVSDGLHVRRRRSTSGRSAARSSASARTTSTSRATVISTRTRLATHRWRRTSISAATCRVPRPPAIFSEKRGGPPGTSLRLRFPSSSPGGDSGPVLAAPRPRRSSRAFSLSLV